MSQSLPPESSIEFQRPIRVYVVPRERERYWIHLLLLLCTLLTTLVVGARLEDNYLHNLAAFSTSPESLPMFPLHWILQHPSRLLMGLPFSLALMGILLAHEMGHYVYCRRYHVDATLPYFIPAPTLIGTLGAFIKIRSSFRNTAALFDIGIAGPIAGFVVAVPVSIAGLVFSKPTAAVPDSDIHLGFPLLFDLIHRVNMHYGVHPAVPLDHLLLHPLAIAGWVGMFATSLNLLPGGQLDGGHIVFSASPKLHRPVSWIVILALLPLAYYGWVGWLVWAVVLGVSGLRHPTVREWEPLSTARKWLFLFAALMLVLTFIPAPFKDSGIVHAKGDILQLLHGFGDWLRHFYKR